MAKDARMKEKKSLKYRHFQTLGEHTMKDEW
jgi:hypothetical protein